MLRVLFRPYATPYQGCDTSTALAREVLEKRKKTFVSSFLLTMSTSFTLVAL